MSHTHHIYWAPQEQQCAQYVYIHNRVLVRRWFKLIEHYGNDLDTFYYYYYIHFVVVFFCYFLRNLFLFFWKLIQLDNENSFTQIMQKQTNTHHTSFGGIKWQNLTPLAPIVVDNQKKTCLKSHFKHLFKFRMSGWLALLILFVISVFYLRARARAVALSTADYAFNVLYDDFHRDNDNQELYTYIFDFTSTFSVCVRMAVALHNVLKFGVRHYVGQMED